MCELPTAIGETNVQYRLPASLIDAYSHKSNAISTGLTSRYSIGSLILLQSDWLSLILNIKKLKSNYLLSTYKVLPDKRLIIRTTYFIQLSKFVSFIILVLKGKDNMQQNQPIHLTAKPYGFSWRLL